VTLEHKRLLLIEAGFATCCMVVAQRYDGVVMAAPLAERREATRESLARTTLWLLVGLEVAIIVLVVLQAPLRVPPESIHLLERLFDAVLGLALLALKPYCTGPR
jgi:hypothetical protein